VKVGDKLEKNELSTEELIFISGLLENKLTYLEREYFSLKGKLEKRFIK